MVEGWRQSTPTRPTFRPTGCCPTPIGLFLATRSPGEQLLQTAAPAAPWTSLPSGPHWLKAIFCLMSGRDHRRQLGYIHSMFNRDQATVQLVALPQRQHLGWRRHRFGHLQQALPGASYTGFETDGDATTPTRKTKDPQCLCAIRIHAQDQPSG